MAQSIQLLHALLLDLFNAAELRGLAAIHYPELANTLPGDSASQSTLALELASSLRRTGSVDDRLFEILNEERPRRASDIARIKELFLAIPSDPPHTLRQTLDPEAGAGAPLNSSVSSNHLVVDDSTLAALVGDDEIADGIYVVLRGADETTIAFVAEPAFDRRIQVEFLENRPSRVRTLWTEDAEVDVRPDGPHEETAAWSVMSLPLGVAVTLDQESSLSICTTRIERAWLLVYKRSQGRSPYYFVLLSARP